MIIKTNHFNLRHQNTMRMDVNCNCYIEYDNRDDLPAVMSQYGDYQWIHIGAGSNLLFTGDFNGTVIHSRILDMEVIPAQDNDVVVRVGAGVEMDSLAEQICQAGLWGLENLSGIPGEAGASAVQNVGAYGVEASNAIDLIECYDTVENKFLTIHPDDCAYGYRTSIFKQPSAKGRYIITHVSFRLSATPSPILDYGHLRDRIDSNQEITPMVVRKAILEMRGEKLPDVAKVGSAGSFFKNPVMTEIDYRMLLERINCKMGKDVVPPHFTMPDGNVKVPAAWLIEKSGLKGFCMGGAATWSHQPLVIVNNSGNASPAEILALENKIIETVSDTFGVTLTPEVELVTSKA